MDAYGSAVKRTAGCLSGRRAASGAIPYELAAGRPRPKHHSLLQIGHSAKWPGLTKPGFAQGEPGVFYLTGKHVTLTQEQDSNQWRIGSNQA